MKSVGLKSHKNGLSEILALKETSFTQYYSYLNRQRGGLKGSCNIDGFMATYISKLKWVWKA